MKGWNGKDATKEFRFRVSKDVVPWEAGSGGSGIWVGLVEVGPQTFKHARYDRTKTVFVFFSM